VVVRSPRRQDRLDSGSVRLVVLSVRSPLTKVHYRNDLPPKDFRILEEHSSETRHFAKDSKPPMLIAEDRFHETPFRHPKPQSRGRADPSSAPTFRIVDYQQYMYEDSATPPPPSPILFADGSRRFGGTVLHL